MAGTTIDELVIKIALDASGLKRGQTEVEGRLKTIKEKMEDTGKQAETSGKRMAEFFNGARDSALGLIAALTGTAGLVKVLADAAKQLAQFGNAAAGIGIDVSKLSAIELAIARIGGSAEATAAALASGARRMVQASFGNDADYSAFLGLIGGTFSDKQDTVLQKLAAFADANREKGQQFFNAIAEKGGYGALENELWKGLTQYNADVAHQAPFAITPEQVKTAQEFYGAWNDLINAFETANRKFETAIMPWLKPLIEDLAQFIEQEPDAAIAIEGLAAALSLLVALNILTGLASLASGIGAVSAAIAGTGGLTVALGALAGVTAPESTGADITTGGNIVGGPAQAVAGWIAHKFGAGPQAFSGARADAAGQSSFAFWKSKGLSDAQAAGMAAQEIAESGGNPNARGDYDANGNPTAFGAYQWHGDRRAAILAATGIDVANATIEQQRQAAYWEYTHTESATGNALRGATSAADAGRIATGFERPKDRAAAEAARAAEAERILRLQRNAPPPKPAGPRATPQSVPSWLPDWYRNLFIHQYPQTSSANSDNSVTIAGDIHVHTQATDAPGIAASFKQALQQHLVEQADRTLA